MPRIVQMKRFKVWAAENLPPSSELRKVLHIEEDEIPIEEYIERMKVWLMLGDIKLKK